jgi:hypothetical protein
MSEPIGKWTSAPRQGNAKMFDYFAITNIAKKELLICVGLPVLALIQDI